MSNCSANVPRGHQFAIADYGSASGAAFTRRLACSRFGFKGVTNTVEDDGIADSLWPQAEGEIISQELVTGPMVLNPRAADLQAICLCLFGDGAFAVNVKDPGNICNYFQVGHSDPVQDQIYRYNNCVTSSFVFSASDSSPLLNLVWNAEGQSRTILDDVDTNWPALALSTQQPFVLRQAVLTFDGAATRLKSFSAGGNHNLQLTDFYNSLNRVEMPVSQSDYTFEFELPWDATTEGDRIGTAQDISATLNFVSGTKRIQFEWPKLFLIVDEPEIAGRNRIHNRYACKAKHDPANAIPFPIRITVVVA